MATLRTMTLGYNENTRRWDLTDTASDRVVKSFRTKREATQKGVLEKVLRSRPASIRIGARNGRIQEERTYPRELDPRRFKG